MQDAGERGEMTAPSQDMRARPPLSSRATFLVHRINAQILQICNPVLAAYDLDLYSSRILVALAEFGPMKVGGLVELMALPQSTISHQIKRLEKLGYLSRARSAHDNRAVEVSLTLRGAELAALCDDLSAAVYGPVRAAMAPEELETLVRLLGRMFDNLPRTADLDLGRDADGA